MHSSLKTLPSVLFGASFCLLWFVVSCSPLRIPQRQPAPKNPKTLLSQYQFQGLPLRAPTSSHAPQEKPPLPSQSLLGDLRNRLGKRPTLQRGCTESFQTQLCLGKSLPPPLQQALVTEEIVAGRVLALSAELQFPSPEAAEAQRAALFQQLAAAPKEGLAVEMNRSDLPFVGALLTVRFSLSPKTSAARGTKEAAPRLFHE